MADALDSKSSTRKSVWVQVPPRAPDSQFLPMYRHLFNRFFATSSGTGLLICLTIALVLVLSPQSSFAGTKEEEEAKKKIGQIKLTDTPFEKLSHQKVSERFGTKALRIQSSKWKHTETEHFIIHYQVSDVRDRLAKEAEFYYWKIKHDLVLTNEIIDHKSHIFIFENEATWRQFQANVQVLGIGAVTVGKEFFCFYPKRQDKEFSAVVAHEMTHLVFNRFFERPPPLWLNEGFAEYQGEKAFFSFYTRHYENKRGVDPKLLKTMDFLEMTQWDKYPGDFFDPKTNFLYFKSRIAVEVLMEKGGPTRFVGFINSLTEDPEHGFTNAFTTNFSEVFKTYEDFLKEMEINEKRTLNKL